MTVGTETFIWTQMADNPKYNRCSPNLELVVAEVRRRFGTKGLGCYGERNVRGGEKPSAHSHGAADDERYQDVPGDPKYQGLIGRVRCVSEMLPWLIANSHELHIGALHDYVGARIWHADRTAGGADGWKPASKNAQGRYIDPNMGDAVAGWIHIEVTLTGWADTTPIAQRGQLATPGPVPIPTPGGPFVHKTIRKGDINADVYAAQVILRHRAGQNVICDGVFANATSAAVANVQRVFGLTADSIVGPRTWAALDMLANS